MVEEARTRWNTSWTQCIPGTRTLGQPDLVPRVRNDAYFKGHCASGGGVQYACPGAQDHESCPGDHESCPGSDCKCEKATGSAAASDVFYPTYDYDKVCDSLCVDYVIKPKNRYANKTGCMPLACHLKGDRAEGVSGWELGGEKCFTTSSEEEER